MPDDRHENTISPAAAANLEVSQLTTDVAAVLGTLLTFEGAGRAAAQLHRRGVRSGLHVTGDRVSCPWCEKTFPSLIEGRIPFHKILFMSDTMECRGSKQLVAENGGRILQMSEVPGHVEDDPAVLVRPGPEQQDFVEVDPDGTRTPIRLTANALTVFLRNGWTRGPGNELHAPPDGVRAVPGPIPERKLPEGVYNVIHFVQLLDLGAAGAGNPDWRTRISDGRGGVRQLTTADLKAVLAEIPDVAPRYPTIWAYEQACRTIRERDARIDDALTVLEQRPPDPDDQLKVIRDAHETLRLRMPRVEPATPEQLSEVARALELAEQQDTGWIPVESLKMLANEVRHLRTLGDTLAADFDAVVLTDSVGDIVPCGTCSAAEPPVTVPAVGRSGRGWPRCAPHLVEDALEDAGLEKDTKRCPSCHHLASSHYEDGSGCSVTIRDVGMGHDNHCPCTYDARSVYRG